MEKKEFNIEEELREYRKFALSRNMVGVAIALVMANACQKMVNSIAECLLMPLINYFVADADGGWKEIKLAITKGLELDIGVFGANVVEFLITSLVLYVLYFKFIKVIAPEVKLPS